MKFFNDKVIPKKWFVIVFGIKVFFGIILTFIFTYYYTDRANADIYKYFDDSKSIADAFTNKPLDFIQLLLGLDFNEAYFKEHYYQYMSHWYRPYNDDLFNDTHIIIRFNAFVRLFSFDHFMVHNVFINFLSLIGLTFLFKAFKKLIHNNKKILFYFIFFTPSILFWGSGVLKESLIFFGFGLLIYHLFQLTKTFNVKSFLLILFGLLILIFTKFYLVVALFIPVIGFLINHYLKFNKVIYGYLISFFLLLISIIVGPHINSYLNFVNKIAIKQQVFYRFVANVPTNSGFKIAELSDVNSLIINIPNALINTFFRPYLWECKSAFVWLSAFENYMILIIIAFIIYFRKKLNKDQWNSVYFNLSFVSCLFILIGLTTPVFGAIMRYKIPGVLLLLISLALIIDVHKLKNTFPFLKKII
jgi:hypothetical protein